MLLKRGVPFLTSEEDKKKRKRTAKVFRRSIRLKKEKKEPKEEEEDSSIDVKVEKKEKVEKTEEQDEGEEEEDEGVEYEEDEWKEEEGGIELKAEKKEIRVEKTEEQDEGEEEDEREEAEYEEEEEDEQIRIGDSLRKSKKNEPQRGVTRSRGRSGRGKKRPIKKVKRKADRQDENDVWHPRPRKGNPEAEEILRSLERYEMVACRPYPRPTYRNEFWIGQVQQKYSGGGRGGSSSSSTVKIRWMKEEEDHRHEASGEEGTRAFFNEAEEEDIYMSEEFWHKIFRCSPGYKRGRMLTRSFLLLPQRETARVVNIIKQLTNYQ